MGAMKTILFSLATTDTAGPSADVSVPTRKSTLSLRMSSRDTRTASSGLPLVSRMISSSLRPSTPPLALVSSTNICAPLEAGSPKRAPGPDMIMGKPTLIGFCASAANGTVSASVSSRVRNVRRRMQISFVGEVMGSEGRTARHLHTQPVQRRGGGDEERSIIVVAPREVRGVLGNLDDLQQPCLGVEHVNAARAAAVDVAGGVDLHAVRRARLVALRLRPHAAVLQAAARGDVEDADVLAGGVVDEQA